MRKRTGHSIAELGPALFLAFCILVLPLATLASIGTKFTFMYLATENAARMAGRCKTFKTDSSAYQTSATTVANQLMNTWKSKFSGLGVNSVKVSILQCDVNTKKVTKFTNPLTTVDPVNNVYSINVEVNGDVEPLYRGGGGWFGNVPGLSAPFPVRVSCSAAAENPSGLTK